MTAYRAKLVDVIEALKWTGYNLKEMSEWAVSAHHARLVANLRVGEKLDRAVGLPISFVTGSPHRMEIATFNAREWVGIGDYVICGMRAEFYACKPDIFEATHERDVECPTKSPFTDGALKVVG